MQFKETVSTLFLHDSNTNEPKIHWLNHSYVLVEVQGFEVISGWILSFLKLCSVIHFKVSIDNAVSDSAV